MNLNKRNGFALILIALGVLFVLKTVGITLGPIVGKIIGLIMPIVVMYLGYIGMKHGRVFLGGALFIIGFVILLGKLSWLIGLVFAVGLIIVGLSMLKGRSNVY